MFTNGEFSIENGKLIKYHGSGGNVVIPNGITAIGKGAFSGCSRLKSVRIPKSVVSIGNEPSPIWRPRSFPGLETGAFSGCTGLCSITIPDSVTSIGEYSFSGCTNLTNIVLPESISLIPQGLVFGCSSLQRFTIPNHVNYIGHLAFSECKKLGSIVIPDGVTEIGDKAFSGCSNLTSITLPHNPITIGNKAFEACSMLSQIYGLGANVSFGEIPFGSTLPKRFYPILPSLIPTFSNTTIKKYVLDSGLWNQLSPELQVDIFITRQTKSLQSAYACLISDPDAFGNLILSRISNTFSPENCDSIAAFCTLFAGRASEGTLRQLYEALLPLENAAHALKTIRANASLMNKLGVQSSSTKKLSKLDATLLEILQAEGKTEFDVTSAVKKFYGLNSLPKVDCVDGSKKSALAMAYLFTAHEKLQEPESEDGQPFVVAAYEHPGLCEHAAQVLALLNPQSFQAALQDLAAQNLGLKGRSKKMFLSYPICRYADEALMADLVKRAPKWASTVSGYDAPALYTFRKASVYSETRAAMLSADKFGDLEAYAKIRSTDADTIRDKYLSDIGLDAHGGKVYDLGSQSVTVRLQADLSFLVELPSGKTMKSLPKKGADAEKFATTNADFSEIKKAAKKIVKNRAAILFADFLSGRTRKADDWQEIYLNNPLLRQVASLLVWMQGGNTFLLTQAGTIRSDGTPCTIGSGKITLAHPMEMTKADLTAWQKYFSVHQIKQPFEQIWEPVVALKSVTEDRYKGRLIPYYRFINQEKHGIHVYDWNYNDEIAITFDDCDADVVRIDWLRHYIEMDHRFEIQRFSVKQATRKANHIVTYLDRITIQERILEDDTGIAPLLSQYTLAQITEFLALATENDCTNVTALLLDYKNRHFADFDPLEEFSLEL